MNNSSATRMSWVDLVKGTSVVLVVLMHSALLLEATNPDGIRLWDSSAVGLWNDIGTLLDPFACRFSSSSQGYWLPALFSAAGGKTVDAPGGWRISMFYGPSSS